MTGKLITLGALALALAACKGEEKKATGGNAQGEILPGSVSDAMLPLDTVTSQPPLAPKSEGGEKPDAKAADKPKAEKADSAQPVEGANPVPASEEQAGEE